MRGEKLYNLNLRVTFYVRVSTDSLEQLNSLDNQINYYKDYICNNSNWIYVDGYVEYGVSGVSVDKRINFKRMIEDAKNNLFDLIITKEVSRFARDLEDSIHYIRLLKSYGVGVFFENQNLNTIDINSELILNIMFNLAQEESKKLSMRVKFGHREAIKKGHVLGSSNIIGYRKDNCKLVIDKDEAKVIRLIFELYSSGKYGLSMVSKILGDMGYFNKNNNLYDKDTIKGIITNPKYKGYYRGHTYEVVDYRLKKRNKIDVLDQVIYKDDNIPAIVSEELWDKANDVLISRSINYDKNKYGGGDRYAFSSRIKCLEHGCSFQRKIYNNGNVIWGCSRYIKDKLKGCYSPLIKELDLYNIVKLLIKNICLDRDLIFNNLISIYDECNKKDICYDLDKLNSDKNKLFKLFYDNYIDIDDFKDELSSINNKINLYNSYNVNLDKDLIYKEIGCLLDGDMYLEYIYEFIDRIVVSKINNDRNIIKLDMYVNFKIDDCFDYEYVSIDKKKKYYIFVYNT